MGKVSFATYLWRWIGIVGPAIKETTKRNWLSAFSTKTSKAFFRTMDKQQFGIVKLPSRAIQPQKQVSAHFTESAREFRKTTLKL